MYYKVSRASWSCNDITSAPPCKEAVVKTFQCVDERTCGSPEEFDNKFGQGSWLSVGTNHTVKSNGNISRILGTRKEWAVKISNLKQLQDFIKKYGSVVVDEDSLIIYDDYIE